MSEPPPTTSTSRQGDRRRRRRLRHALRRPRTLVALGLLTLFVAGGAWIAVTGWIARGELEGARAQVAALQQELPQAAGGAADPAAVADVQRRVAEVARRADRAHRLTTGPAWAVAAHVPWLGRPLVVVRGVTATVDMLGQTALPALGQVADGVGGGLRDGPSIDLRGLTALAPTVTGAARAVDAARAHLAGLPTGTWLSPVDRARRDLQSQVDGIATGLGAADTALQVLPPLLGADTPQRLFLAIQNNAEARGTGGLPGAFAILTTDHGTVSFERFESDDTLVFPRTDVTGAVDFGAEQADFLDQYGFDLPFGDYRESNESPHFPYAAQIWAAMWEKYSGEPVTGAIAIDPTALSYLLAAVGPVTLDDGTVIDADTIVALTQRDVYARFAGLDSASIDARKVFLLQAASDTEKALLGPGADTATLVRGAVRAIDERRLLVWSADPAVEAVLARTPAGGVLPETDQPFGMLAVINVAGSKLDYYLDRRVTWTRSGCGDTRDVTVGITVSNRAPASGLPAYVTYRADDPPAGTPVGSNRIVLDWFATDGATLQDASVGGAAISPQVFAQRGHPVYRTIVELGPGASTTYLLHLREPAGAAPVTLVTQPLVRPITQTASDDAGC